MPSTENLASFLGTKVKGLRKESTMATLLDQHIPYYSLILPLDSQISVATTLIKEAPITVNRDCYRNLQLDIV